MCLTTANLFASKGYQVSVLEVLTPGPLNEFLHPSIRQKYLNRKSKWSIGTMRKLVHIMKEYNVVHVHMRHVYRYVFLASLFTKKKLILHDHFNTFPENWKSKVIFRILLKRKIYVSVNQIGSKWATDFLQLSPDRVFNVSNIIIPKNVKTGKHNSNKLVLVSNIKPEKYIEFIIPLALEINRKDSSVVIDVIGKIMDKRYYKEILTQLKTYGIQDRVRFITNVDSVQDVLCNYALGLHFSKKESGPLVLLEYLAQSLPFVAYRTGEVAEKLYTSLPMFFMTNHDELAWSEKVLDLRHQEIDYTVLNTVFNANNSIEEYFNQWLRIYERSLY
ncbi:MAG: Glycosyltransferase Gtf1 [Bacteroidetes bacterium OLB12]|nr:MAG: Glycosyltransferase Gtf1 [Bacteroidetes bacterium OLB12]